MDSLGLEEDKEITERYWDVAGRASLLPTLHKYHVHATYPPSLRVRT